jgi:hypothetical protein
MSEIEANKQAHRVVLETKESVMRSLAKQNSQLVLERDALTQKVQNLGNTVDQLTGLLRSMQMRRTNSTNNMSNNSITSSASTSPASIQGGPNGGMHRQRSIQGGGGGKSKSIFFNTGSASAQIAGDSASIGAIIGSDANDLSSPKSTPSAATDNSTVLPMSAAADSDDEIGDTTISGGPVFN